MNKEIKEVPIELYATRNGEFIKYVKYEDYIDLQQRIDKAVEYIRENNLINNLDYMDSGVGDLFKNVLDILKGDDTNE